MVPHLWPLILLLGLLQQTNQLPELLTPAEKAQLARQTKIDGRIKVYQTASERFRATVSSSVAKHDYSGVVPSLASWADLLEMSAKDIDKSITNRKKKSGALIRYEIHLRRAITEVQAFAKSEVPVDEIDHLDAWLTRAEAVHQQLVDILFPK